ncbi:MAG: Gfo/Idh/MocA family protein [Acidimicrobiales bacterium]
MTEPLRVGVLGATSRVARLAVMPAIEKSRGCEIAATASLSDRSATHDSYEALVGDDRVEAVYVPLPNSMHREWVERCATAGKHVLCEKPLAPTARDAEEMAKACESAGVVLMEAYMTMFHPRNRQLIELARSGEIGRLLFATAAFTGSLERPDDHRLEPAMGGGALLDVGIYCLTPILSALLADPFSPEAVRGVDGAAHRAPSGVDASFSGWLDLGEGTAASFQCSFEAPERQLLELVGTKGALTVERAFTPSTGDTDILRRSPDGSASTISCSGADPYLEMVEHFGAAVRREKELERTPAQSIALARLVDRLSWSAEPGSS